MNNYRQPALFLLSLFLILIFNSCRSHKEIAGVPRNYLNTRFLIDKLEENKADLQWLSARCKINFKDDDRNISATVNLKMQHDSALWMSVTPLLGIELARVLITPDSAIVMDRINKQYQVLSFDEVRKFTGVKELTFELLQDLLLGNAIVPVTREFDVQAENGEILLTHHHQFGNEMLWLLPAILRPSRLHYENQPQNQAFDLYYSEYQKIEGKQFPQAIKIDIAAPQDLSLDINFTRYTINEPQEMPFSIPSSYDRKK